MSGQHKAESLKEEGNVEFKKGNFLKAAGLYTKAMREDPDNAVLFSNRCAALLKLSKISKALSDAERVISIRPEWEKGYFRKASIYEAQEQYDEALEWYKKAAECNKDSRDVAIKIRNLSRLVKAQRSKRPEKRSENGSSFAFDKTQ